MQKSTTTNLLPTYEEWCDYIHAGHVIENTRLWLKGYVYIQVNEMAKNLSG